MKNKILVSEDRDHGRVWVACKDFSVVLTDGAWRRDAPSADDLKDNFERVRDPKEADVLFRAASAAVASNPNLLRAPVQPAFGIQEPS